MKTMGELNISTRIRQALRVFPDGMTVRELAEYVEKPLRSVDTSLRGMPDSYIDRWVADEENADYIPVWCVAIPPLDCPKPDLIPKPIKSYKELKEKLKNEGRAKPKTTYRKADRRGHDALVRRTQGSPNKS